MFYRKYQPTEILSTLIECYFIWDSEGEMEAPLEIESPPLPYCSLVFNYGANYFLHNKKYEKLSVPRQFLAGPSTYSYRLMLQERIGIAGIVFKPAALATIFNLPVYEYVEERVDLYKVFKKEVVDKYALAINTPSSETERVKILEEFILSEYRLHKPEPDYIDYAANFILKKNGNLQVNDLLKDSCMSRRTFERKFFQKVGLSPKYFARIGRIGYICNLIAGKRKADWQRIFYECEYYDQAHFIKDFEEFVGRSPQQYIRENTELANFVEKPSTRSLD